jgi:hypothetical protein
MAFISKTPEPPYYAVIFTSINADVDHAEHVAMSRRMVELAATYDEHRIAKKKGREIWYSHYMIRICKVEREYGRPD